MSAELSSAAWKRLAKATLAASDICWLCGRPGADTADHIIERSRGGAVLDPANVAPAHGTRRTIETHGYECPGNYGRSGRKQRREPSRDW